MPFLLTVRKKLSQILQKKKIMLAVRILLAVRKKKHKSRNQEGS